MPPPEINGLTSAPAWSLIGVELPGPIINDSARELNFTNEIGHGNTVRLLRNIIGLWLVGMPTGMGRRQGI